MNRRTVSALLALTAAASLSVGAYLWVSWHNSQPVDPEQSEELTDRALVNLESLQRELDADIAAQPRSEVEARLESPLGQALFRRCAEWIEFFENHPDEEVRGHRDEACREYRDYVETGVLPEDTNEPQG